jgi:hypothetical protein
LYSFAIIKQMKMMTTSLPPLRKNWSLK